MFDKMVRHHFGLADGEEPGKGCHQLHEERCSGTRIPGGGCGARRVGGCGGVPREPGPCTAARVPMFCVSSPLESVKKAQ